MNDESLVSSDAWQELTADSPDVVLRHDNLLAVLGRVARRHHVMVNITVSPYESEVDDE